MTNEEVRDELARLAGWRIFNMPSGPKLYLAPGKPDDADCQVDHPVPATLDGAAAALPEGWTWARYPRGSDAAWVWVGIHVESGRHIDVPDTGDEMADRYRLAVLCRIAANGVKPGEEL